MAGYIKKAAQAAKRTATAKKLFSEMPKVTYKPAKAKPKSVTKYPGVARVMGAEGPKKSSPRPGGVGKGGGRGVAANKPPKKRSK